MAMYVFIGNVITTAAVQFCLDFTARLPGYGDRLSHFPASWLALCDDYVYSSPFAAKCRLTNLLSYPSTIAEKQIVERPRVEADLSLALSSQPSSHSLNLSGFRWL